MLLNVIKQTTTPKEKIDDFLQKIGGKDCHNK